MEEEIVNRVAQSNLVTFDLESLYPNEPLAVIDLRDNLYEGQILREKDLREFVKSHPWNTYQGKLVAVGCSTDAIIPTWAYMLVGSALEPFARRVVFGDREALLTAHYHDMLTNMDWSKYRDARVVLKGCGDKAVPASAYLEATTKLRAVAHSVFYGEPCSTVPIFKRTR